MSLLIPAIALCAALVFWITYAGIDKPSWPGSAAKTLSVALLALYGGWVGAPGWVVLGLGLGAVGDFALSRPGTAAFLAGMLAFALGHLAYVFAFVTRFTDPTAIGAGFWGLAAGMAVLIAVTWLWIAPKAGALRWPVRGYALIIGAMALTAALLPPIGGRWVIQTGVIAFVASDLILALRLFVLTQPHRVKIAARTLWPLYWGGQALILLGVLWA